MHRKLKEIMKEKKYFACDISQPCYNCFIYSYEDKSNTKTETNGE